MEKTSYENGEYLLDMARYDISGLVQKLFMSGDDRITMIASFKDIQDAVTKLYNSIDEYREHLLSSATRAEICGGYTVFHSINVSMISMYIAMLMGKEQKEGIMIGIAGLLHDIGKKYISEPVINKAASLSSIEQEVFKMHPQLGHDLIATKYPAVPTIVTDGILQHHERMNGQGYPYGVSGISEVARVIAIADVFEAYTAVRPYHSSRPLRDGFEFIRNDNGLDQNIVDIFCKAEMGKY